MNDFHKRVLIGVELEAYSIGSGDYQIGRRLSRPRPGLSEDGERFARDTSIGSEYNSRPFETVREASFLLKSGLRKYIRKLYRSRHPDRRHAVPLLVGGWSDRFAGTHLHISLAGRTLERREACSLAWHIHDHIPFLIAIGSNSPIWAKQITTQASNRFLRATDIYFRPVMRGELTSDNTHEMVFSPGRKRKPPTLELRVLDSNLPQYIVVALALVKAITLRWLKHKGATNRIRHSEYIWARLDAGVRGIRCTLPWQGEWMIARQYLDRFLWEYREELEQMDVPPEVYDVLRLIKRGYTGARLIHEAALIARREHPQTWQRRFAKRYSEGLEDLLSGNSLWDFAAALQVELPDVSNVWLGRRHAPLGA